MCLRTPPCQAVTKELYAESGLTALSNLDTFINRPSPPPLSFLDNFDEAYAADPISPDNHWVVYFLRMVKDGEVSLFYVGTASDTRLGSYERHKDYMNEEEVAMPKLILAALHDGYKIDLWVPVISCMQPHKKDSGRVRGLLLGLEATLAGLFNTYSMPGYPGTIPTKWTGMQVGLKGLCTHSAITELKPYTSHLISDEEFQAIEAERPGSTRWHVLEG